MDCHSSPWVFLFRTVHLWRWRLCITAFLARSDFDRSRRPLLHLVCRAAARDGDVSRNGHYGKVLEVLLKSKITFRSPYGRSSRFRLRAYAWTTLTNT